MAEPITKALSDGALEGEHAPALSIEVSLRCSLGPRVFDHVLCSLASNIAAAKSQARGLVLVAFRKSPSYYLGLLRSRGFDPSSSTKWLSILDCFSDPLNWKARIQRLDGVEEVNQSAVIIRDVKDVSKLLSSIINQGKGIVGQGKVRFAVAFDSLSELLRHAKMPSVAGLLNNLRSHGQISSILWLVNPDLIEPRTASALKYIATMVGSLEPTPPPPHEQRRGLDSSSCKEQSCSQGKFLVRMKRRNGRVKLLCEELNMEEDLIKFSAVSFENTILNQNIVPKVQFNLQLSEKERADRARVVLPFEHQGGDAGSSALRIYDGRRPAAERVGNDHVMRPPSLSEGADAGVGAGEIHYLRDSDDEKPDSDEDPDDDLDI